MRKFTAGHTVTPRQSWHRDIDRGMYPEDKGAFSILAPLTMDIPVDGREGQFVAHSWYGIPDPWRPFPMGCTRGQAWVFDSRPIHRGGTVPAEATADRIILFISLSEIPYNYAMNVPIREPSWAPPPIHYSDPAPGCPAASRPPQPRPRPPLQGHHHHHLLLLLPFRLLLSRPARHLLHRPLACRLLLRPLACRHLLRSCAAATRGLTPCSPASSTIVTG